MVLSCFLAEVQARTYSSGSKLLNVLQAAGSTVDDEGITNNYASHYSKFSAEYPWLEQQRYAFQGAVTILFVAKTNALCRCT